MGRKPVSPEELRRREKALEDKYGSPEALKKKRQEWQAKSRLKYSGNGGFRSLSPEKLKEISKRGHEKRWGEREEAN